MSIYVRCLLLFDFYDFNFYNDLMTGIDKTTNYPLPVQAQSLPETTALAPSQPSPGKTRTWSITDVDSSEGAQATNRAFLQTPKAQPIPDHPFSFSAEAKGKPLNISLDFLRAWLEQTAEMDKYQFDTERRIKRNRERIFKEELSEQRAEIWHKFKEKAKAQLREAQSRFNKDLLRN